MPCERPGGGPWATKGLFEPNKALCEIPPQELGPQNEQDGTNVLKEGVNYQVFVAFGVQIPAFSFKPRNLRRQGLVIGMSEPLAS